MCLAKMQFDDNDIMHLRLLQSVYLNFVGGPGPVGRYVSCCSYAERHATETLLALAFSDRLGLICTGVCDA